MKLTRICLEDFRCFRKAAFELTDPERGPGERLDVALLVGDNGSGKSAVIQALNGFFTALITRYGGEPLTALDVRQGATECKIVVSWSDRLGPRLPRVEGSPDSRDHSYSVAMELWQIGELHRDRMIAGDINDWSLQAERVAHQPTGLVTSFDVYRLLPPGPVPGPTMKDAIENRCDLALAPTISSDGKVRPRAQSVKQWIVNLDFLRARAKADRNEDLPLWHALRHALNTLLHPYTFEGVDDRFAVIFQTPTGRVPIEALSDGFRSVFAIVAELLLRLSLCTDQPEKVLEQEGVCLIDEIDANLHPLAGEHHPWPSSDVSQHPVHRDHPLRDRRLHS